MEQKNIQDQFNRVAKEYDANRRRFIPCFEDYYEGTTKFIAANCGQPAKVQDLGAGTGLLTYYWYKEFPNAEYTLLDIAEGMLDVAKERFNGLTNVKYKVADYSKAALNDGYDCIISALSIHHLTDADKKLLFQNIYNSLPENGIFVNYDQFCGGSAKLNSWMDSYWESGLLVSGLSAKDIELWKERRLLDKECSVEDECIWLNQSGFKEVKCVYSCQKFSVIVAIK